MKFLAIERDVPGVQDDQCAPHLRAEAGRAWELYQSGVFRELYFRADRDAAVLVMECSTREEAEGILATLPLVREGLIRFELIPLAPYPGFSRLFGGVERES
jgi:muconolactone delta-isomerase